MRSLVYIIVAFVMLAASLSRTSAGIDPNAPVPRLGNVELVVMEADGCIYCSLFRRDVLPAYQTSENGKDMPVRFMDVNKIESSGIELDSPINIVPTFVVTKNNREIGRIPGYVGPENFFHAISYIVGSSL
jgi:thioredoxin-related protein